MAEVEAAYEAIMMRQLAQRMKGQITGGLKVSKDLAYADNWVRACQGGAGRSAAACLVLFVARFGVALTLFFACRTTFRGGRARLA